MAREIVALTDVNRIIIGEKPMKASDWPRYETLIVTYLRECFAYVRPQIDEKGMK